MSTVIHWFRRDLRLSDNLALHAACQSGAAVLPLFVIDPALMNSPYAGVPRVAFLLAALRSLDEALRKYDSRLLIRTGKPADVIAGLVAETGAEALYVNRDYSPYARHRDESVNARLNIPVHEYDDALLMPPGTVMTAAGKPYTVYTPFRKNWDAQGKPAVSMLALKSEMFHPLTGIAGEVIPSSKATIAIPEASERAAGAFLDEFLAEDIHSYSKTRNILAIQPFQTPRPTGTSYLSPYLRFGLLSPRQAYHAARALPGNPSIDTWVSELAWREFYMHILYYFPYVLERDFKETYFNLAWSDNDEHLQAWKDGRTGFPVIDAPMRQLKAIGWMPNRARMIVASFLTKDLLIHWKHGELHFMQHLIDGDPAANNGGWQWAAGTGTDAQPYFRIFNPASQSKKFASPEYLRYWLPELKDVSDKDIHAPGEVADYPRPIVNHAAARKHTIAAFKQAARRTD